ncbi:MAG: trehalase family glycosidase, partial [Acidobacteria bacterium]|nr:trehalase family glycosidase [Acidobacteriota bacterium]
DWYLEMDAAQKKLEDKNYDFLATMPYTVPNSFLGIREVYLMTGDRDFLNQSLPLMRDYELRARRLAPPGSILTPFQMMVDEFDYSLRWKPVQKTFTKGGLQRAFDLPVEMVDVNSYLYELRRILADAYTEQQQPGAATEMRQLARRTAREINARFWDASKNFYCDTRSDNHASTGVRAISGFAPLYVGIAPAARRAKLIQALDDPKGFASPYPVPSIEMGHPELHPKLTTYGGDSLITTGVWTLVNALAANGEEARAAKYLARTVEMMTKDGVSSSYSYHTVTGAPNQAKHTLATQSAIVNDLIARYVVGLSPLAGDAIEFRSGANRRLLAHHHRRETNHGSLVKAPPHRVRRLG